MVTTPEIAATSHNDDAVAPSAETATPHLTINHDVAADLDSGSAFEGPEKLLEVWFAPSATALPPGAQPLGLKAVPETSWVEILDMVNCKILSVVRSETVDAYLLSESSMFVFPHKIILKTCGTTTLLLGLHRLLRTAAVDAGFPTHNAPSTEHSHAAATPFRVFYSRKNFLFPDRQQGPHRSWKQEVKFLDDMFESGSAYMVGKMNGDHWYLYITSPYAEALTPPRTPPSEANGGAAKFCKIPAGLLSAHLLKQKAVGEEAMAVANEEDETLEILMTDLDQENAKQFYLSHAAAIARNNDRADAQEPPTTEGHALGTVVTEACGLADVYPKSKYPDARIDAYMFEPCGFSANGVIPDPAPSSPSSAAHYFTVHVTPEPQCSFASFETNVPSGQRGETSDIIQRVVDIFRPGRFSVTLFESKAQGDDFSLPKAGLPGYRRIDRSLHDLGDYDLNFRYYERIGWVGDGVARIGEDL